MKRYLLFSGLAFFAYRGWRDFVGDFDGVEQCKREYAKIAKTNTWGQIVDTEESVIIMTAEGFDGWINYTQSP